jgi:hypothetical protein
VRAGTINKVSAPLGPTLNEPTAATRAGLGHPFTLINGYKDALVGQPGPPAAGTVHGGLETKDRPVFSGGPRARHSEPASEGRTEHPAGTETAVAGRERFLCSVSSVTE